MKGVVNKKIYRKLERTLLGSASLTGHFADSGPKPTHINLLSNPLENIRAYTMMSNNGLSSLSCK